MATPNYYLTDEEVFMLGKMMGIVSKYDLEWTRIPEYLDSYGRAREIAKRRSGEGDSNERFI